VGHDPDPAAEAEQLRGLIRDAHAAVKDLRAAIRDADRQRGQLDARVEESANQAIRELGNHLQLAANELAVELNANVEAARQEIANHLFDARIEYDEAADNFMVVFRGAKFAEDTPAPYPERT
jgi:F0F1-type ATP synthase membrane subunit b/b'